MTYTIRTRDGTSFLVDEIDLEFIKAYLVLGGYPPVSVEVTESMPMEPDLLPRQKSP